MRDIYLWWIGADAADGRVLSAARQAIERTFVRPVHLWTGHDRPADAFDPRRQQHSSTRILQWLIDRRPEQAQKVLALTDVDLFIPILTFVFGEAQLDGAAAVVSTARLRPNHGGGLNGRLLTSRLAKECVHELGHTFGLIHCNHPGCVMTRSVSVLDVDAKTASFCQDCRAQYQELEREGRKDHEQRADSNSDRGR